MISGQRFEIDLGDDAGPGEAPDEAPQQGPFVGNILERKPGAAAPPAPPTLKSKGGFPEHRKRTVESKFKQRKTATPVPNDSRTQSAIKADGAATDTSHAAKAKSWEEEEKQRIDLENRQKLAQMSPDEIEDERRELMNSLSPALLQRLLQRSHIESGSAEDDLSNKHPLAIAQETTKPKKVNMKSVSFAEPQTAIDADAITERDTEVEDDDRDAPVGDPLPHDSVHFPRPSQPPDLDPSSETFFEDLHTKYFPSLPTDPEKLEWMQPSTDNAYNPSASALKAKDLRFSFRGELIPPRLASEIPVTAGLHHHGDAPEAAGYTIAELAHLSQSSYPAQRCIAFQTLGRVLYRLGRGEFGDSGEPGADVAVGAAANSFGELARGLWYEVEKQSVIEILVRESEGHGADRGRHVSAKAYATEAVWLWRKGGGRRWKAQ